MQIKSFLLLLQIEERAIYAHNHNLSHLAAHQIKTAAQLRKVIRLEEENTALHMHY